MRLILQIRTRKVDPVAECVGAARLDVEEIVEVVELTSREPDYNDLLPYVNLLSDPPRARPRFIAGMSAGYEHRSRDRARWSVNCFAANITGRTALYNFQSALVGTRVVEPRSMGLRIRIHF